MVDTDDSKPPRKTPKRAPRRKSKKKETEESKEKKEEHILKRQIQEALSANLTDYVKKKNLSQKQVTILNSFIEEHLSCFILLGYTVDGNTLSIVNAQTQKDSDSLGTLLQKFIVKHLPEPPLFPPIA